MSHLGGRSSCIRPYGLDVCRYLNQIVITWTGHETNNQGRRQAGRCFVQDSLQGHKQRTLGEGGVTLKSLEGGQAT